MKNLLRVFICLSLITSYACQYDQDMPTTECQTNCALKPEVGPCNAAFPKYYFDAAEKKCKQFTWGGCNGVVPFQTLDECEKCGCK